MYVCVCVCVVAHKGSHGHGGHDVGETKTRPDGLAARGLHLPRAQRVGAAAPAAKCSRLHECPAGHLGRPSPPTAPSPRALLQPLHSHRPSLAACPADRQHAAKQRRLRSNTTRQRQTPSPRHAPASCAEATPSPSVCRWDASAPERDRWLRADQKTARC